MSDSIRTLKNLFDIIIEISKKLVIPKTNLVGEEGGDDSKVTEETEDDDEAVYCDKYVMCRQVQSGKQKLIS